MHRIHEYTVENNNQCHNDGQMPPVDSHRPPSKQVEVSKKAMHCHGQATAAPVLTPDRTGWADQTASIAGPMSMNLVVGIDDLKDTWVPEYQKGLFF